MKILMVCLGNICRSPMAEGDLRHKVENAGLDWQIDSCGTGNWHQGEAPDPRAQKIMLNKGIDISDLQARQIRKTDLERFDFIFVMDRSNLRDVLDLCDSPAQKQKVKLLLQEIPDSKTREVPDPYYGGDSGFELVFDLLDKACTSFIESQYRSHSRK